MKPKRLTRVLVAPLVAAAFLGLTPTEARADFFSATVAVPQAACKDALIHVVIHAVLDYPQDANRKWDVHWNPGDGSPPIWRIGNDPIAPIDINEAYTQVGFFTWTVSFFDRWSWVSGAGKPAGSGTKWGGYPTRSGTIFIDDCEGDRAIPHILSVVTKRHDNFPISTNPATWSQIEVTVTRVPRYNTVVLIDWGDWKYQGVCGGQECARGQTAGIVEAGTGTKVLTFTWAYDFYQPPHDATPGHYAHWFVPVASISRVQFDTWAGGATVFDRVKPPVNIGTWVGHAC